MQSAGIDASDEALYARINAPLPPRFAHDGLQASLQGIDWTINEVLENRRFEMARRGLLASTRLI